MSFPAPPPARPSRTVAVLESRGFTVIEVMAAVVILSIALLSLLRANNQSVLLRARSQEITTATLLAQERLATFSTAMEDLEEESEGDFGEGYPHWRWTLQKEEVEVPFDFSGLETVKSVTSGDEAAGAGAGTGAPAGTGATAGKGEEEHPPIQKLTLTVFWPEGVGEGSLTFTEYITPLPEETEEGQTPSALPLRPPAPAPRTGGGQ